jgi:hypothetical protein
MSPFARNHSKKIAGNRLGLLLSLSFLIDSGLCFWEIHAPEDSCSDTVLKAIIAILFSLVTFDWVALALAILCSSFWALFTELILLNHARSQAKEIAAKRSK